MYSSELEHKLREDNKDPCTRQDSLTLAGLYPYAVALLVIFAKKSYADRNAIFCDEANVDMAAWNVEQNCERIKLGPRAPRRLV